MNRIYGTVESYDRDTGTTTVRLEVPLEGQETTVRFTAAMLFHAVEPMKGQRVWVRPNHPKPLWLL